MVPAISLAPGELPLPATSTARQSRFSLRSSLSSVFPGSSTYSQSTGPASVSSPPLRISTRSRSSLPFGAARFPSNSFRAPRAMRSRSSTRSLIDASIMPPNTQPLRLHRGTPVRLRGDSPIPQNRHLPGTPGSPSGLSLQEQVLEQEAMRSRLLEARYRHRRRSRIFSRRAFRTSKVRTKATMALAFGFTLVSALSVYLGLAVAGVGVGPMYHTLFILLILALTAVFCHSLLRMFMVMLHPDDHTFGNRRRGRNRTRHWEDVTMDGVMPEKPIPIIMASDEDEEAQLAVVGQRAAVVLTVPAVEKVVVRPPPPVYGNYRGSKRMNPSLVHWQKQETLPPSPLTPTYDEAISEVQRAVGYRPPSYVSEGGVVVVDPEGTDVEMGLGDVHPLERERLRGLIGVAV